MERINSEFFVGPQKILIIDDEENYRDIITMALQFSGYEVFNAKNGLDGLAAAKMYNPDLILCDVNMPKMDGNTLLSTLKEDPEFAGIPFIFLTGNTAPGDMRKGMQLGADDYLTKPFSTEELLSAVKTRLNKKQKLQKYYSSQFEDIKTSILHSLPHEFRTPLNSILGFSQILMEENNLPPDEVQEAGEMIHKSGLRLHHLLENIVLFGQLQLIMNDREKIEILRHESVTMVEDIIHTVAQKQMSMHERADAILLSVKNVFIQMSSIYLTKIMEEIIDNALKFSEAGTTVHISSEAIGSEVHIIIRDEGRGMSEEQIHRISAFQQFERGYYEQQGAGLGLVIVKTLAELHGGNLSIESIDKQGTTVIVRLPKLKEE
ncbi:MAG: hybrid sensor histidine kinase/response regulator [Bacteroidota bacterium]|nr:hybrid sensor histidine kinase/response regulator [Bacteroidota bacterium]